MQKSKLQKEYRKNLDSMRLDINFLFRCRIPVKLNLLLSNRMLTSDLALSDYCLFTEINDETKDGNLHQTRQ